MKPGRPVEFFDRYAGEKKVEKIYGDRWLRWTYDSPLGRLLLHLLIRRAFFSRWYGWRMDRESSRRLIPEFIQKYGVDTNELLDDPSSYRTFNEFFIRRLKPEARPIQADRRSVIFPADGRHLAIADIREAPGFVVKGQRFDVDSFLRDPELADRYRDGALLISRLCPVDYHRYHFPVDGVAGESREIDGWLYSVNPIALRRNIAYLLENKRRICRIESPLFGQVLQVEIGATCVGGIVQTYRAGVEVARGEEKGYFRFGGSSVALLFERGRIRFDDDLLANSAEYLETYGKMGDRCASAIA